MKTRLLIISGIIFAAILFTGISQSFMFPGLTCPPGTIAKNNVVCIAANTFVELGQKYQYKFGETTIKNEKDQQFDRVFFSYSHDSGITFSEPQDISMSENTWTGEPKMILMDEDVILVWREEIAPLHTLAFATSDDYGKTLDKKYLWFGSRPDIIHYNDVLYLTWTNLETRQVLYTTSNDQGETFGEHYVIFAPTNEFSPYALKPKPKLIIENDAVKIIWSSAVSTPGDPQNFEYIIGKDEPLSKLESIYDKSSLGIINPEKDIPPEPSFDSKENYSIEITGLKDIYLVGERYDFSYILSGYGNSCGSKTVTFPDSNGDTIGSASSASCIANLPMGMFVFDIQKEQGTTYGHVEITNPGTYTVTVTFDKPSKYFPTTVSKEFRVMEK